MGACTQETQKCEAGPKGKKGRRMDTFLAENLNASVRGKDAHSSENGCGRTNGQMVTFKEQGIHAVTQNAGQ